MAVFLGTIINSNNKPSRAVRRREKWAQDIDREWRARNPTTEIPTPVPVYRGSNKRWYLGGTLGGLIAVKVVMGGVTVVATGGIGSVGIGASIVF